jgi:hypothetical protein
MKKDINNTDKDSVIINNYNLKSDAVDALVNADSEDAPEYSQEELDKYRSRKGKGVPETVKVLFIKAWFSGAVCFFFLWGLGTYIGSMIDMLFILGVALGIVTDLLVNNMLRFIEKTEGANDRFMMFPKKSTLNLFLNVLYSFLIIISVYSLYNLINSIIITVTGNPDTVPLGVEPILFGLFCLGFDMLYVTIKNVMKDILVRAMEKVHGSH